MAVYWSLRLGSVKEVPCQWRFVWGALPSLPNKQQYFPWLIALVSCEAGLLTFWSHNPLVSLRIFHNKISVVFRYSAEQHCIHWTLKNSIKADFTAAYPCSIWTFPQLYSKHWNSWKLLKASECVCAGISAFWNISKKSNNWLALVLEWPSGIP